MIFHFVIVKVYVFFANVYMLPRDIIYQQHVLNVLKKDFYKRNFDNFLSNKLFAKANYSSDFSTYISNKIAVSAQFSVTVVSHTKINHERASCEVLQREMKTMVTIDFTITELSTTGASNFI